MRSKNEIKNDLGALIKQLEEASDHKTAARLRALSDAIGSGTDAAAWAECRLRDLIEPDSIVERYRNQRQIGRTISYLEGARNVLIFAPLIVTWYGISQAVEKYQQLLEADPSKINEPFIYLWQSGFGQRLYWWQTLGALAQVTLSLLSLVFALTIAIYILSNNRKSKNEQEACKLQDNLLDVLASATLYLTTWRLQPPVNFVEHFNLIMTNFKRITEQVMQQIETEHKLLAELLERQDVEQQHLNAFKATLTHNMTSISASLIETQASHTALSNSIQVLSTQAQELSSRHNPLVTKMQNSIEALEQQIAAQKSSTEQQTRWETSLRMTLQTLEGTLSQGDMLVAQVQEFAEQQRTFLESLKSERNIFATQQSTFLELFGSQQGVFASQQASFIDTLANERSISADQQTTLLNTLKEEQSIFANQRAAFLDVLKSERAVVDDWQAVFLNSLKELQDSFTGQQTSYLDSLKKEHRFFTDAQTKLIDRLNKTLKEESSDSEKQLAEFLDTLKGQLRVLDDQYSAFLATFKSALSEDLQMFARQQSAFFDSLKEERVVFAEQQTAFHENAQHERKMFSTQQMVFFDTFKQTLEDEQSNLTDRQSTFLEVLHTTLKDERSAFMDQQGRLIKELEQQRGIFSSHQTVYLEEGRKQYELIKEAFQNIERYTTELNTLNVNIDQLIRRIVSLSTENQAD